MSESSQTTLFKILSRMRGDLGRAAEVLEGTAKNRVSSLTDTEIAVSGMSIDVVGIPAYVENPEEFEDYGLTEAGWYVFLKIESKDATPISASTIIEGADGYIATPGELYLSVAVRFDAAALSRIVVINWGTYEDAFTVKATDLAVRNLNVMVTYRVYPVDEFATWEYALTADTVFTAEHYYYTRNGEEYEPVPVSAYTIGDPIPAYYVQVPAYALTTDTVFASGTDYYTLDGDVYTLATVTEGEAIPVNTYYVATVTYARTEDTAFVEGTTYYTKSGATYVEAEVTAGDPVPAYYGHSKVTFAGMSRNVTYSLDTVVDCPSVFILPEIADDGYGAWFEFRFRHSGSFSSTLVPPSSDVKVASEHTQAETKGVNMVNLHYTTAGGAKVWRFMNTHSTFTASAPVLSKIEFRTLPTKTEYAVGEAIDGTGAVVVATYEDGSSKLVTPTYPATYDGAPSVTASYTEGEITALCTFDVTMPHLETLVFTTNPTKMSYVYGEAIDYTGAVLTATFANGASIDVTAQCTFSPAQGTIIEASGGETETMVVLTAYYTAGNESISESITAIATVPAS